MALSTFHQRLLPLPLPLPPLLRRPAEAQMLARAIKEHERRDGRREGFADTPADVLAYKYFRDVRGPGGTEGG